MKKLLFACGLVLTSTITFAQSEKFVKGMEKSLQMLDDAKTHEQFTDVSAAFERIGDAEKTQWLPYYYSALANILDGFSNSKVDRDQVATTAEKFIAKAEAIEPKNSELFLLKSMASTLRMLVDPASRWQEYGTQASTALATAKQLDANNPRVYYMEGQTLLGTPEQFGGGKSKALPVIEKSVSLFSTFKPASPLHPHWGKSMAEQMLAQSK